MSKRNTTWLAAGLSLLNALGALAAQQFDHGYLFHHLPAASADGTWRFLPVDVDGDGDLDLISGRGITGPEQDQLWINDGKGRFFDETAARLPIGATRTYRVAAADIDGDGDPDLAFAADGGQPRMYANDGTGRFTDVTGTALPTLTLYAHGIAFADVDRDADQDLLLATITLSGTGRPYLLANDGSGVFSDVSSTALPPAAGSFNVALAGDFTGNGASDFALLGSPCLLLSNDGSGRFAQRAMPGVFATSGGDAGDWDGDGDLDLVVASPFGLLLWQNDGTGSFADVSASRVPPTAPGQLVLLDAALVDADGDTDLDVVMAQSNSAAPQLLYANDGFGFFTPWPHPVPEDAVDFSDDVLAADLTGDGAADLLLAGPTDRAFRNDGAGRFTRLQAPRVPTGFRASAAAAADFDGDSLPDLALGTRWLRNDGRAGFAPATPPIPVPVTARDYAAGDLDGDGDFDLAAGLNGMEAWLRNDGSGTFVNVPLSVVADDTRVVVLGDVDGDGDLDLITGNSGQDRIYTNDGSGTFADVTATSLPAVVEWTFALVLLDVDFDLDLDLLALTAPGPLGPGALRLYLGDGAGHFQDASATHLPNTSGTLAFAAFDFDGDSAPDLYVGTQHFDYVLVNDGSGHFAPPAQPPLPAHDEPTIAAAAADLDRDGDVDLVVLHGGGARLYRNQVGGSFTEEPGPGRAGSRLQLVDLDRDGDPDLFAGSTGSVLANRHIQTEAPWVAFQGDVYHLRAVCRPDQAAAGRLGILGLAVALAPAPIPVTGLGLFHLEPNSLLPLSPWLQLDPATGASDYTFTVPTAAHFAGQQFYVQALTIDPAGSGTGLSNLVVDEVRR